MARQARHGSLRSEVYRRLQDNILRGLYQRGTTLTEQQVATSLGVSRTPIREAFSQLELDGLVSKIPNKGAVVQGFDDRDIEDLYEVRTHMESLAAVRAARDMSQQQRLQLKEIYERECRFAECNTDFEKLQDLDNAFHEMIFKGTGSKILVNILNPINIYTRHARSISLATPGRSKKMIEEHGRILEAILTGDSRAAGQRMVEHINHAAASFKALSNGGRKMEPALRPAPKPKSASK
jgi:DNA-binding GntR family transcriptional regulator